MGDFRMTQSTEIRKFEGFPFGRAEDIERGAQSLILVAGDGGLFRRRRGMDPFILECLRHVREAMSRTAAEVVNGAAPHDGTKPCEDRAPFLTIALRLVPDLEK